jgi:hypothetical protein
VYLTEIFRPARLFAPLTWPIEPGARARSGSGVPVNFGGAGGRRPTNPDKHQS